MSFKSSISIICFVLLQIVFAEDDFYCYKERQGKYEVCQTVKDVKWNVGNEPNGCKCANVKLEKDSKLIGGVDHCQVDGWCYTIIDACEDEETDEDYPFDVLGKDIDNLVKSNMACDAIQDEIGNEPVLENYKITTDQLEVRDKNGAKITDLTFIMDSVDECKEECEARNGEGGCGAWSFDKNEEICHLFNVNSCCGQFGKREPNPNFTSGYHCPICWSTKNDCPCDEGERSTEPGSAHNSGAKPPNFVTSTGELRTGVTLDGGVDPCSRLNMENKRRNKCRGLLPTCKDKDKNPNGTCQDPGRCRKNCPKPNIWTSCSGERLAGCTGCDCIPEF